MRGLPRLAFIVCVLSLCHHASSVILTVRQRMIPEAK